MSHQRRQLPPPDHDQDIEVPDYRATITRTRLVVNDWAPWLATGGPMGPILRQRGRAGVALADLTVLRDEDGLADELVVDLVIGDGELARAQLLDWAGAVGYRRVWFPDELVELDAPVGGVARVRCETCRARWEDDTEDFWTNVRQLGRFPSGCPLCGDTMPQWEACDDRLSETAGRPRLKNRA
jgi:hypothetical protein